MKQKKGISKWVYWFSLGVALIIAYKCVSDFAGLCNLLSRIISVAMPFFMAIIIAYLFYKPVSFMEKIIKKNRLLKNKARFISVLLVYAIAILLIALLINWVIPPVKDSIVDLVNNIPSYIDEAKNFIDAEPEDSILKKINVDEIKKKITEIDFMSLVSTDRLIEYVNTVIGVFSAVFSVFVTIIVSIYILLERGNIKEFLKKLGKAIFDNQNYTRVSKYFRKSNSILLDFIYCQIIDGILVGILVSIAMSIIGIKYSVLLGMFIGLFNIIPYFGAIIAIAISLLITLFTGGFEQTLIMAITVIIIQQIDSNIINPKILGDGLKISPILVIFAVTIGGEFFGVLGMFLAVPIIAIIKLLITDFVEIRSKIKMYRMRNLGDFLAYDLSLKYAYSLDLWNIQ